MKISSLNYGIMIILLLTTFLFSLHINKLFKNYEIHNETNKQINKLLFEINKINSIHNQYIFTEYSIDESNKNLEKRLSKKIDAILSINLDYQSELKTVKRLNSLTHEILLELYTSPQARFFSNKFIDKQKNKILNNSNRMKNVALKISQKSIEELKTIIQEIKMKLTLFVVTFASVIVILFIVIKLNVLNTIGKLESKINRIKKTGKIEKIEFSANNEIGSFISSFNELVDKKIDAETKYEKIFKYSNLGIAIISKEGILLKNNKNFENIFETQNSMLNKNIKDILKNEIPYKIKKDLLKLHHKKLKTLKFIYDYKVDEQNFKCIDCSINIVWNKENDIDFYIVLIEDITQIHKLKEKEKEQEILLVQQSRLAAMGEMLGSISHQWRQPLNSLGLIFQDLFSAYKYDELTTEYFESSKKDIMNQLTYMSETIDEFRNFLKEDKAQLVSFCVYETIQNTISLYSKQCQSHQISIEFNHDDNLKEFTLKGNNSYIKQVLMNLISNAKDAILNTKTKNDKKIIVNLLEEKCHIIVEVIDFAGGIDQELKNRIFEPYFTTKVTGTELGLYMCKMILEKSFKTTLKIRDINISNQKGSCFYFHIKKD